MSEIAESTIIRYYESIKPELDRLGFTVRPTYNGFVLERTGYGAVTFSTVSEINAFVQGYQYALNVAAQK